MPTWIVVRHNPTGEVKRPPTGKVLGSITAAEKVDALVAAHARWTSRPLPRLELLPIEHATPAQRKAAGETHFDLEEERLRLHALFEDRLSL